MSVYDPKASAPLANREPRSVWTAETPAVNSSSSAISLERTSEPRFCSIVLVFSANPGTFQIDFQVADFNEEKYYVTKDSLKDSTVTLNSSFVARAEEFQISARWVRLNLVSMQNAVTVTAHILQG